MNCNIDEPAAQTPHHAASDRNDHVRISIKLPVFDCDLIIHTRRLSLCLSKKPESYWMNMCKIDIEG